MTARPSIVLLGPQRFQPTLHDTLESIEVHGTLAVVTTGWQERESEVDELREHVGLETLNLELYRRHIEIERADPELAEALRERQERLQRLQRLYRMRLGHALAPARLLLAEAERDEFHKEHCRAAIRMVRTIDRQHLTRIRAIHREFEERWNPAHRGAVAAHRAELARLLDGCNAIAIAGGNVGVLINRLRLFEFASLIGDRPVVAWSAGAMALAEQVVLFHDHPPQGAGDAEVFDAGLGLYRTLVPLPHASTRLRLDDPARVELFARRFSPALCALLDSGARLDLWGETWRAAPGTRRLTRGGKARRIVAG